MVVYESLRGRRRGGGMDFREELFFGEKEDEARAICVD